MQPCHPRPKPSTNAAEWKHSNSGGAAGFKPVCEHLGGQPPARGKLEAFEGWWAFPLPGRREPSVSASTRPYLISTFIDTVRFGLGYAEF